MLYICCYKYVLVGGVKVNMWFESTIRMVTGYRGQISIQPKLLITVENISSNRFETKNFKLRINVKQG